MHEAAANLKFEEAARLGDEIKRLKTLDLEFAKDQMEGALFTCPGRRSSMC